MSNDALGKLPGFTQEMTEKFNRGREEFDKYVEKHGYIYGSSDELKDGILHAACPIKDRKACWDPTCRGLEDGCYTTDRSRFIFGLWRDGKITFHHITLEQLVFWLEENQVESFMWQSLATGGKN